MTDALYTPLDPDDDHERAKAAVEDARRFRFLHVYAYARPEVLDGLCPLEWVLKNARLFGGVRDATTEAMKRMGVRP